MGRTLALGLMMIAAGSMVADAAVRGGKFTGTINATIGNSATATLDFAAVGNARAEVQDIGGIGNDYTGTYTEYSIGVFSYWTGDYKDLPSYQASGFSFFGVITSYSLTNQDVATASGWLVRSGSAVLP